MSLLKSMERTSSLAIGLSLVTACNGRPGDPDDSTTTTITTTSTNSTDGILDMGVPAQTEWEGIIYVGPDVGVYPSRFVVCDTGMEVEIASSISPDLPWSGSCDGVFLRFKATLDETVDPARLIVEEYIEARWCAPDDCGGGCEPDFDSCYQEQEQTKCDPLLGSTPDCGDTTCKPKRFFASEGSGWMHHVCFGPYGEGTEGSPCEFPVAGAITESVDTCAHGYRCWNSAGTLDTGVCVPYCDMAGLEGPACAGECVQCSSSERGLCMTDCSGDGCRVEEFC